MTLGNLVHSRSMSQVFFLCVLRNNTTASKPINRPEKRDSTGKPGIPNGRVVTVAVVVVASIIDVSVVVTVTVEELDKLGCGGSTSDGRGGCEKSKSLIRFPRMGEFSRTSGLESGLPSFRGSIRCPFKNMSSMNFR